MPKSRERDGGKMKKRGKIYFDFIVLKKAIESKELHCDKERHACCLAI